MGKVSIFFDEPFGLCGMGPVLFFRRFRLQISRFQIFADVCRFMIIKRLFFCENFLNIVSQVVLEIILVLDVLFELHVLVIIANGRKLLQTEATQTWMGIGTLFDIKRRRRMLNLLFFLNMMRDFLKMTIGVLLKTGYKVMCFN